MSLSYTELKPGVLIEHEEAICEVLESEFLRMQQRKPVMKTKLRDIMSGKVREVSFQPSDSITQAELERMDAEFIYGNEKEYWFHEKGNPSNRFSFTAESIGDKSKFLKPKLDVTVLIHKEEKLSAELPIKVDLEVVEAPPSIKGDTSSGGTKVVTVETGAKINTPLFINQGDVIRVNTQTGEYSERAEKA